MTSRDFAYWLQGFFEIQNPSKLNPAQTELIKKHLSLVFIHEIDPSFGKDLPILRQMHNLHIPNEGTANNNNGDWNEPRYMC